MSADPAIYQRILDADIISSSGLPALLPHEPRDDKLGYIVVTEAAASSLSSRVEAKLLPEVHIPASKHKSYDLARALFDNYNVKGHEFDELTAIEQLETDALISFVASTAPMQLAKGWIEARTPGGKMSPAQWEDRIRKTWFRAFRSRGGDPTRSGFEHVFLGEWNTSRDKVGGFHWWYFYHVNADDIKYKGAKYGNRAAEGIAVPEIATMAFDWEVDDGYSIGKKIGGFHVGPSVEGLMAIGMVRAAFDATPSPPRFANIAGMHVELAMYNSGDSLKSINTMYPIVHSVVAGSAPARPPTAPLPPTSASVPANTAGPTNGYSAPAGGDVDWLRIMSVLANPEGHDIGRENVTVINMYGPDDASAAGWQIQGPNKSALTLGDVVLARGQALTVTIRKGDALQLWNKGGTVRVVDPAGVVRQTVKYAKKEGRVQGGVLVWDGKEDLVLVGQ